MPHDSEHITKPPILISDNKEVFFSDGWELEKHFYIEQSDPYPCIVQAVDIYVDTTNE